MNIEKITKIAYGALAALIWEFEDSDSPAWDALSSAARETLLASAQALISHPTQTPETQHEAWRASWVADGWILGPVRDFVNKTHPMLKPYAELPELQRKKDALWAAVVRALIVPAEIGK